MALRKKIGGLWAAVGATIAAGAASAQTTSLRDGLEVIGAPEPGGMNFQQGVTSLAHDIRALDTLLLVIVTAIVLFVTALLAWTICATTPGQPVPASFTHNTKIEVTWTVVPLLILIFIGAFSLPVLFKQQTIPEADVVVKATGYQWYWGYEYPEEGIEFLSVMLAEDQLAEYGYTRDEYLLATDAAMVVPRGRRSWCRSPRRRDPLLDRSRLRREAGRRAGTPGRAVVRGRAGRGGRLFRPVFGALRHGACLHAHHGLRRDARGIRGVAGRRGAGIRLRGQHARPAYPRVRSR
jgi:heme/copper-type cytochrome/quinol oxidase subunit 2